MADRPIVDDDGRIARPSSEVGAQLGAYDTIDPAFAGGVADPERKGYRCRA